MTLYDVFIIGLSTFALTYMLRNVDGPFDVFHHIRKAGGLDYVEVYIDDENNTLEVVPDRFIPKLLSCFWCLGTWVALVMIIIYHYVPVLVAWFAVVGLAGSIHEALGK